MLEKIIFAGGCFWCTEAIFQKIEGIISIISGYSGGEIISPSYKEVCSGNTDHAEAIEITFDTNLVNLEKLLFIFWRTHDPTSLNKQGNDIGTQYRSAIFYFNEKQKEIIFNSKNKLEELNIFNNKKIVTEILPYKNFYKAEDYHQNYYNENKYQPYCLYVIDPKLNKLEKLLDNI